VLHHELVYDAPVVAQGLARALLLHALVHINVDEGWCHVRGDAKLLAAVRAIHFRRGGWLGDASWCT